MGAWRRSLAVVVLSGVAINAGTGCSLALSGPDPKRAVSDPPECDTGKGLIGLDGVIGGSFAIGTLALAANDEGTAALITGLFAAAFIGSAVRGNSEVNECRTAMASYSARDVDRALDEPRIATKPAPPARRPAQPPSVMQPEPGDPYGDEPPYQAPHANPALTPPPVAAPAVKPAPATKPAQTPVPAPTPAAEADEPQDWKDFWTEVP